MSLSETARLVAAIERFRGVRVLCVGDVMLDHYVYGTVDRISPEAPIPVLQVTQETRAPGGAGNVLRNLETLGAQCCFVSVVGGDDAGRELKKLAGASERVEAHLLVDRGRTTTLKTRYVAGMQQMLRADRESIAPIKASARADLLGLVRQAVANIPSSSSPTTPRASSPRASPARSSRRRAMRAASLSSTRKGAITAGIEARAW